MARHLPFLLKYDFFLLVACFSFPLLSFFLHFQWMTASVTKTSTWIKRTDDNKQKTTTAPHQQQATTPKPEPMKCVKVQIKYCSHIRKIAHFLVFRCPLFDIFPFSFECAPRFTAPIDFLAECMISIFVYCLRYGSSYLWLLANEWCSSWLETISVDIIWNDVKSQRGASLAYNGQHVNCPIETMQCHH